MLHKAAPPILHPCPGAGAGREKPHVLVRWYRVINIYCRNELALRGGRQHFMTWLTRTIHSRPHHTGLVPGVLDNWTGLERGHCTFRVFHGMEAVCNPTNHTTSWTWTYSHYEKSYTGMNVFRKGMNSFRNGMNMFRTGIKTFRIGTGIRGNQNYQKIRKFSGSKNLKEFFQNSNF